MNFPLRALAPLALVSLIPFVLIAPALADDLIRVTGHGERKVAPDVARLSFRISAKAKDAPTAQANASAAWIRVKKALTEQFGIEPKDLLSTSLSVTPETVWDPKTGESRIKGFEADHGLNVTVRKLDQVGKLVDSILPLGQPGQAMVQAQGIQFAIDRPEAYEPQALAAAMKQARERAEAIAEASGRSLKGIRMVVQSGAETGQLPPPTPVFARAMSRGASEPESTQVAPSLITISADVTVDFGI